MILQPTIKTLYTVERNGQVSYFIVDEGSILVLPTDAVLLSSEPTTLEV